MCPQQRGGLLANFEGNAHAATSIPTDDGMPQVSADRVAAVRVRAKLGGSRRSRWAFEFIVLKSDQIR